MYGPQVADDHLLVERLRARDEEAFMDLVRQWSPSMLRVARMYVPSQAVAEDVVQETWLGVLNGIDRFEGRSSLRRWEEPERALDSAEAVARIQSEIDKLPEGQRLVITMRDVDGLSSEEVRSALEISETNQRVLLHRARSKVRAALEDYYSDA